MENCLMEILLDSIRKSTVNGRMGIHLVWRYYFLFFLECLEWIDFTWVTPH